VVPGSNGLGIGANQFVKLEAYATFWAECDWKFSVDNDTDLGTVYGEQRGPGMPFTDAMDQVEQVATGYVFVASPGPHTYYLEFTTLSECRKDMKQVTLIATTYPLGWKGTDELMPAEG
jgi:hypothetical protein